MSRTQPDFQAFLGHVQDMARTQPNFQAFLSSFCDTVCKPCSGRVRATMRMQPHFQAFLDGKGTLPLTIPRRVFKSSAKDSAYRSMEIVLQGDIRSTSAVKALPTTCAPGAMRPLLRVSK
ncbi:Hypothetical predicted protein [Olea europaea subsp. europaea]|uniref:Uncharacterized protein n=1 Tax=Olea europaea subsp. europaea TaxID=158383 RepID=A0A8S0STM9_OLEEU|nr:Hypothetical predicted protein [Olea europaea subsp. europaea]